MITIQNGFIHIEEKIDKYVIDKYFSVSNIKSISQLKPVDDIQQPTIIEFLNSDQVTVDANAKDLVNYLIIKNESEPSNERYSSPEDLNRAMRILETRGVNAARVFMGYPPI
ncbi:hypothetical protein MUK70_11920 [Dyadobacter chenwenxiniae]|uniref:Uncharacterized protein n=1 Tax=Dyadobacter chenwenxiniae TaxID=2906456 RepID=A0A9X1TCQ4_9BACT|nr:hypothetical protein [Dyadobacter chenwenxiniae]MCF0059949.1 hypothetical protein [Dyadobacter chenwenxiniae]UON85688.1 hypothetical protein MUK70_11920 [Dyadobacter chenwenxiniae]